MTKFNICIVSPNNYIHSMAFLELAELISFSLNELNYQSNITYNSVEKSSTNILIGCHLLKPSAIKDLPKSTIILNTEQIGNEKNEWLDNIYSFAKNFSIWDYSQKNVQKFQSDGVSRIKLLRIGYQKELERIYPSPTKDIDVLFYGCINQRRQKIITDLSENGLNVKTLFGIYGKERDQWISRSRLVLNHHFYSTEIFEIVRVFYLATNKVAVVSEVNPSTAIDPMYLKCITPSIYDELTKNCITLALDTQKRRDLEQRSNQEIKKYPQKYFTAEALG